MKLHKEQNALGHDGKWFVSMIATLFLYAFPISSFSFGAVKSTQHSTRLLLSHHRKEELGPGARPGEAPAGRVEVDT